MSNNFDLKKYLVENKLTTNSKMLAEGEESKKPSIKVLRNLYYFDKLGSVAAKEDIDEKYHKDSNLIFKKGTTVKDDTKHDDSEYEMIIKSKRLKKGTDYKMLTESEEGKHSKRMNENEGGVKTFTIGDDTYRTYQYDIDALKDDAKEYLGTYDGGIKGYDGDESVDTGADYQWAIARGDDFPHAIIVKNPAILKDEAAMGFIRGLKEAKKAKHSKRMNENEGSTDSSKSFTVISSYASRNDRYDYTYGYIKNAADAKEALIKYLTTEENYSAKEALDYVEEIEVRFSHEKLRRGKEMWATDDEYYVVVPGEIDNDAMESILKSL